MGNFSKIAARGQFYSCPTPGLDGFAMFAFQGIQDNFKPPRQQPGMRGMSAPISPFSLASPLSQSLET